MMAMSYGGEIVRGPREAPPVPLYNRPGPGCPGSVT